MRTQRKSRRDHLAWEEEDQRPKKLMEVAKPEGVQAGVGGEGA